MKMIQHKRTSTSCYWSFGRCAVGWFYGFSGQGWVACYSGREAVYLRLGRFVLACQHQAYQPTMKWCYCWPKGKIVR